MYSLGESEAKPVSPEPIICKTNFKFTQWKGEGSVWIREGGQNQERRELRIVNRILAISFMLKERAMLTKEFGRAKP